MKWYELKEQSAGHKRLLFTWLIYKLFDKYGLYFVAYVVAFFTFIFNKNIRGFSKNYFTAIEKYSGLEPSLYNIFKHINSYAISLADKIILFSGNFKTANIIFENDNDKDMMFRDINKKHGVFFICSHIGNIEILQSLINDDFGVNMFLSKVQSQIFNSFLEKIRIDIPVKIFNVEDIGIETGIKLKENLDNGDIVFIAGDRLSQNNNEKTIETNMFEHKISLPKGAFKLAQLMEVPIYFICAIKKQGKYKIYIQKEEFSENIAQNYTKFLEKITLVAPYQFYHFYDFFD